MNWRIILKWVGWIWDIAMFGVFIIGILSFFGVIEISRTGSIILLGVGLASWILPFLIQIIVLIVSKIKARRGTY